MGQGALSVREKRKRETSRALIRAARRLTAERGFTGFTVEELCVEVGLSRRTFFNYFESKENAVFGFAVIDSRQEELEAAFLADDGEVLDDFIRLTVERFGLFDPLEDAAELFALVEQEPRLLKAAFEQLAKNERRDIDLIVRRTTGVADAELRAEVTVHAVGALVRLAMEQLLHHHSPASFEDLLVRRLDLARTVFSPSPRSLSQKAD
ncbi:TetR family transcriptional regulator [Microbacterium sp. 179-I 3D3 NHS]|uniref:TetR family transcriptional regulator n=1 Tax=Microbacterium sp. 179-I 3D3 NHS TaxID=3142382 RepID=UPI0039A2FD41